MDGEKILSKKYIMLG